MSRTHTVQIRMDDQELARLDSLAGHLGATRSSVLRKGVQVIMFLEAHREDPGGVSDTRTECAAQDRTEPEVPSH